jgi:hypothetical protein
MLEFPSRTTPAWKERSGLIAVEVMLAGVRVIAYDSCALPDVASGGGVLGAEGVVARLAEVIARLAYPGFCAETVARRRRWALEHLAPEPLAAQLVELCREGTAA